MADEPDRPSQPATPAAALSPEFLTGGTKAGLEKIRARLLDLTNRNRLLNFRHSTASSLRIVGVSVDAVFQQLIDGKTLSFRAVPEPETVPALVPTGPALPDAARPPKPSASEHAATLGWNTSFDLDGEENAADLPVLLYIDGLEALTRKIGSAAKTAIEESGTNMLYLILGFLEWYESDDSQQPRLAPLLTVPIGMDRQATASAPGAKGRGFECSIEHSGEDFASNLSLAEKMRADFGIETPSVGDDDTPETYFRRFDPILEQQKRWRIRRQITLSLLSFGKLLMYRDLDPRTWPDVAQHPLVRDLFEGLKIETISHAEEYAIDEHERREQPIPVILDADSSQHSALIDALGGQNLVIEGPPGTGKSQTITNLIAAALGRGKTVLFISEKLAALEVVRRRLDAAGLGVFCLELHSHKTRKDALLGDISERIKVHRSFPDPVDLDAQLANLQEKKRILTRYVDAINQRIEPFRATVFEVLWARDRHYQHLPFPRDLVEKVLLPSVLGFDRADFARTEQFLAVYAEHLAAVFQASPDLEGHPWAWVGRTLTFQEEEELVDRVRSFTIELLQAEEICEVLERAFGVAPDLTVEGLACCRDWLAALPGTTEGTDEALVVACRADDTRAALSGFVHDLETASEAMRVLQGCTLDGDANAFLREHAAGTVTRGFQELLALGFEGQSIAALKEVLKESRATAAALADAADCFGDLAALVDSSESPDARTADLLLNCLYRLEAAPYDLLHLRGVQFESEGVGHLVRAAEDAATALTERQAHLGQRFDIEQANATMDVPRLKEHAKEIAEAGLWRRWFGGVYRSARRAYQQVAVTKDIATPQQMAQGLASLAAYLDDRARFDSDEHYQRGIGPGFVGVDSDWSGLRNVADWYEGTFAVLPSGDKIADDLRHFLLTVRSDRIKSIRSRLGGMERQRSSLGRSRSLAADALTIFPAGVSASRQIPEILESLRASSDRMADALLGLAEARVGDEVPLHRIRDLRVTVQIYEKTVAGIAGNQVVHQVMGSSFAGVHTDVALVRHSVKFAESVVTAVPRTMADRLLSDGMSDRLRQLRGLLAKAAVTAETLTTLRADLDVSAQSTLWTHAQSEGIQAAREKAELSLRNRDELPRWAHFIRLREESRQAGLAKLTNLVESATLEPKQLVPAFCFVFYNTLARGVFVDYPGLSAFSGLTQDQVRKQFSEIDKRTMRLYRERLAATIDRRSVPTGNHSGPVGTWTELALVNHETKKQKRHIPIRQIVNRAGRALQAMKPCFMMGPLSVAQYLEPGNLKFDLVVMDEASQLKPEDAIGAIARGAQIVVVGDPKQLPPTNFFQRVAIEDEDDPDRTVVEEGESILDVASTLYQPVRRLRWHYRSRHHSLIAFSNREFYRDLVIFPSAYHDHPHLGVRYRPVHGTFENRRNPIEAAAIVEAVMQHMERRPNESLGVVGMNFEQRELIEELLDRRLRSDPFALAYQERMNSGAEPFFIKNLENVQGDERDVIFISTTYGADLRGNQYQRFGPINGPNGHRRLNVLFTRAKKRVEVFSSLDPDKIQTDGGVSWGVRVLKDYLTFARTGVLEAPTAGGAQPANDFEESVGAILKSKGFDVVAQVGVAGFFIDLAVRNPVKPGTFVLGIECDGATYHSAKSSRDRDRLRQEILENLGWKIHRVWSTDWFKNRNVEIERMIKRIEQVLMEDPDYVRDRDKIRRSDSLRTDLVALRETEIRAAFPDSAEGSCLLRASLLDEFLRKRPTTKEDWFKMISYELRSTTDAGQVGRYLPLVLDMIARVSDD